MVESTNTTATLGATNSLCLDAKTLDLLVCPELRVAALALLPWQTTGNPVRQVHHCPGQALCASMIVKQRSCFYQASALSISSLLSETSAQEKNKHTVLKEILQLTRYKRCCFLLFVTIITCLLLV